MSIQDKVKAWRKLKEHKAMDEEIKEVKAEVDEVKAFNGELQKEAIEDARSMITNSILRATNKMYTGIERLPGKQTNKKYARHLIKVLEKEVLGK